MEEAIRTRVLPRLKRTAGQVNGIHRLIEKSRYCIDVLLQVAAVEAISRPASLPR